MSKVFMMAFGIFLMITIMPTYAETTAEAFQKAKEYAKGHKNDAMLSMKSFHPEKTFENYQEHPKEERSYQSVEQEKVDLGKKALEALQQDAGGQWVYEHFGQEKRVEINKDNQAIQDAMKIEAESYAITHGISTDKVQCQEKPSNCTPTFKEERCHSDLTDCRLLKDKGCQNTATHCISSTNGACTQFERLYQCPEKTCPSEIICTHNVFCADGNCVEKASSTNDDFSGSASSMAAVGAAGEAYQKSNVSLFGGKAQHCNINFFIDCCSNKGWGKKLKLASCNSADKSLGQAKLDYLVHYVGKYCAKRNKWPFKGCKTWKNSYCIFESKMARIIQEEGRLKQLNSSAMGTPQSPNCNGLTLDEIQRIDMSLINFIDPLYPYPFDGSESIKNENAGIAGDIKRPSENNSKMIDEVTKRIQERSRG